MGKVTLPKTHLQCFNVYTVWYNLGLRLCKKFTQIRYEISFLKKRKSNVKSCHFDVIEKYFGRILSDLSFSHHWGHTLKINQSLKWMYARNLFCVPQLLISQGFFIGKWVLNGGGQIYNWFLKGSQSKVSSILKLFLFLKALFWNILKLCFQFQPR